MGVTPAAATYTTIVTFFFLFLFLFLSPSGPLIRSYGLGADNIIRVTLITADGSTVIASRTSNADLFWALQGGGGGAFGVVTSMVFRVHPAPPQLVSLSCAWPLSRRSERVGEAILEGMFY